MAKEYIERDAVIAEFKRLTLGENSFVERMFADGVYAVLETFPAADVVELVRCKDCKWCTEKDELTKSGHCDCVHRDVFIESHDGFEAVSFDDYCSYGERRDNNAADWCEQCKSLAPCRG